MYLMMPFSFPGAADLVVDAVVDAAADRVALASQSIHAAPKFVNLHFSIAMGFDVWISSTRQCLL